jgi:hypothetical protein
MNKTILVTGLALALTAGAALAQAGPSPAPRAAGVQPDDQPGEFGRRFERHMGRDGPGMRGWRGGQRPTLADVQRRNAQAFALMDANKDGRVTFSEFQRDLERRRLERQQEMFRRFSGGQDSVTLDQLNARAAERLDRGGPGRGPGGR